MVNKNTVAAKKRWGEQRRANNAGENSKSNENSKSDENS